MKYTIIVVNYNKENYLKKCLDSIINQTYKDFEVIVVDDGSTDNSRSIIDLYSKFSNVKTYYRNNCGVSASRNFAVKHVNTDYFLFVDSDDYISEDLLFECSKYDGYDVLSFNNYIVSKNKIKEDVSKGEFTSSNGIDVVKRLMKNKSLFLVPWGYIYNTSFFIKNKFKYLENYVHEDVQLTTMILLKSQNTIIIPYYGYYYVYSSNSIMRSKDYSITKLRCSSILCHYDNFVKYFNKNIEDKETRGLFLDYYTKLLIYVGHDIRRKYRNEYIEELRKREIYKYLIPFNIVSRFKRFLFKRNIKLYFDIYPIGIRMYNISIGKIKDWRKKNEDGEV